MKKYYLCILLFLAFASCDQSAGSNSDSNRRCKNPDIGKSNVIDVSHDVSTGTFTFGLSTGNQAKRFQTFIADCHTGLDAVEVKIRKNSGTDTYNNVIVELYETTAGLPSGDKIAEATIDTSSLGTAFTEMSAELDYQGLVPDTEYAIVLGQKDLGSPGNAGFEWCTADVSSEFSFGKLEGSVWTDESANGDGWLKVYVSGGNCPLVTPYYTGTIDVEITGAGSMGLPVTWNDRFSLHVNLDLNSEHSLCDESVWQNTLGDHANVMEEYNINTILDPGDEQTTVTSEGWKDITSSKITVYLALNTSTNQLLLIIANGEVLDVTFIEHDGDRTAGKWGMYCMQFYDDLPIDRYYLTGHYEAPGYGCGVYGGVYSVDWNLTRTF